MTAERKPFRLYTRKALSIGMLALLLALRSGSFAQTGLVKFTVKKYSFIHSERNEIVNAKILEPLFSRLLQLRTGKNLRVSMVHVGDSHIQADFLTAQVRMHLHSDFGNGGRGFIMPLKLAKSNEPYNIKSTSNVEWNAKRCVFIDDTLPIGLSGVTIQTPADTASLRISTFDYPPLGYAFNKLTLFYLKDSAAYDFVVTDTAGTPLGTLGATTIHAAPNMAAVHLPFYTNDVVLNTVKNTPYQNNATIFGLSLENDSAGVIYNVIGANGAEAFHYANAKYFAQEIPLLKPEVIIISLGTNEAQRRPFDKDLTARRLDSLVKAVQLNNPNVPVILTTPSDSYYNKKYYNVPLSAVHTLIVDYAKTHNLAVWDLYSIAGGYKSAYYWRKYGLLRKDGIHFTRAGYEFQGNLFYEALIKAYNKYVSGKHP